MTDCPNLPNCGFMKKFADTRNLACKGFIALYCRGEQQSTCRRRQFRTVNGYAPPDEMMPNGQTLVA